MARNVNGLLSRLGIVRNPGAAVPHRKNTKDCATVELPVPEKVIMVMQQHIGAPCTPTVKAGDMVYVGTVAGDSPAPFSAPVHSSVSGTVAKIDSVIMPNGAKVQTVVINSDGQQTPDPQIKPPVIRSDEDLIAAVRASGLVGLGGAGFPTHIKLNPAPEVKEKVDTLLINGAECEPYLTSDVREMLENSQDITEGIRYVSKLLKVNQTIIGIEDNKPDAIEIMTKALADLSKEGITARVEVLPSRYPQGAEKVLIHQCTGRTVPMGKLPADIGVVVMNVTSIGVLARYIKTGMPLVTKRVTVDGSAIQNAMNVRVPIGTPIKDIVDFCGGYKDTPAKILCGGPMMGTALMDDAFPVLKQNNGFLFFDRKEAEMMEPTNCIRCGRCVEACPMNLMPTKLEAYTKIASVEMLQKLSIMNCMECGSCAFVCPANRRLVQSIRLGKTIVRNANQESR